MDERPETVIFEGLIENYDVLIQPGGKQIARIKIIDAKDPGPLEPRVRISLEMPFCEDIEDAYFDQKKIKISII